MVCNDEDVIPFVGPKVPRYFVILLLVKTTGREKVRLTSVSTFR